jgi:hypothetical protein
MTKPFYTVKTHYCRTTSGGFYNALIIQKLLNSFELNAKKIFVQEYVKVLVSKNMDEGFDFQIYLMALSVEGPRSRLSMTSQMAV